MADVDEDVIPRTAHPSEDVDLSDEVQDFRFLASISREDASIPKRGEKDFEPHATALQSNTLNASRQAMHNALSFQRVHVPKHHTVAVYHPETNCAYAINPKGPLFAKMGRQLSPKDDPLTGQDPNVQRVWLLPEEVLYLLERGSLDVRWPAAEEDEGKLGLPMSLQGAYAMFLGDEGSHDGALTSERFSVYSGLKRAGYIVMRAPSWDSPAPQPNAKCFPPIPSRTMWQVGLLTITTILTGFFRSKPQTSDEQKAHGPLIQSGLYRDYISIYQRLALINFYDPSVATELAVPSETTPDNTYRITYHVWKPGSTTFKKSAPGPPDFRIAVVNARDTVPPSLAQLDTLLAGLPYEPPSETTKLYGRLKYGHKNVILAIVDQGVTSYLRVADAAFGREKLYESAGRGPNAKRGGRGGMRGGRGGGRGRGRGRG